MGSGRRLAVTALSLCGAAAAGAAFYSLRPRQTLIAEPVAKHADENMTLINAQIFFRHGARTPLTIITGLNEV